MTTFLFSIVIWILFTVSTITENGLKDRINVKANTLVALFAITVMVTAVHSTMFSWNTTVFLITSCFLIVLNKSLKLYE